MSSMLVNKKVPQNLMMLFKNTEGQIHYFLKPLMLNSRILIRKFLKLILSKTLYNLIRKKYNSFHLPKLKILNKIDGEQYILVISSINFQNSHLPYLCSYLNIAYFRVKF